MKKLGVDAIEFKLYEILENWVVSMKIFEFSNNDQLHHYKKALVLTFRGPRDVLSTGPDNGGFRKDLEAVFNVDINPGAGMGCMMRGKTYEEHMNVIAIEDLGLDPSRCSGLCTAASMDNVSIQTMRYEECAPFSVTAVVTAGIEHNGGRVGDPALWHESGEEFCQAKPGTINILLHIDANLDAGALVRSVVTCTEAKVAAIQELQAPSCSSRGIATGSGTDGIIVISNPESNTKLTNAGKNSKLGEYIGKTVIQAVKEALSLQSGLNPAGQHDIIQRLGRFGVTEDVLWEYYKEQGNGTLTRAEFMDRLDRKRKDSCLVTNASLYAHLLDQLDWGLLDAEEVWEAARKLLVFLDVEKQEMAEKVPEELPEKIQMDKEATIQWMIEQYINALFLLTTLMNKNSQLP